MKIKSIVAALGVALSLAAGSASAQTVPGAYLAYQVTITQTHEIYPSGGGKPTVVKDYVTLPLMYKNLKDCQREVKRIKDQIVTGSLSFSDTQLDMGFGFDSSTGTNVYCSSVEVWPTN